MPTIDSANYVASPHAGLLGGGAGRYRFNDRNVRDASKHHEYEREDHDRQDEICDRAGGNNRRTLIERLKLKRVWALIARQLFRQLAIGRARRVRIAKEFHVAAERDPRDLPSRSMPVEPTYNCGTKSDGKSLDFDAAGSRHGKVAELMKEDHHRYDKEKRGQSQWRPVNEIVNQSQLRCS